MAVGLRGRRRVVVIGGALLLGVVGVVFLFSTPFVGTLLLGRGFAVLETRYGIIGHADTVDLDLATLDVRFSGLSLATRDHTDEPFFTVDEARIDLPWSSVWAEISIQAIALVSPRLVVHATEDGGSNLPTPSDAVTDSTTLQTLPIGELTISDLTVDWRDEGRDLNIQVAPTTVMLRGSESQISGPLEITSGITVNAGETQLAITGIQGELAFDGSSIAFDALRVVTPEATLTTTGTIDAVLADPSVALTFDATVQAAPLATLLTVDDVDGSVALTGRIVGPIGEPTVTAAVSSAELTWNDLRLEALAGRLELTTTALRLDTLSLSIAGGSLLASGSYDLTGDGTSSLTTGWERVDADALLVSLGWELPLEIRSSMTGDASVTWTTLYPRALTVTALSRGSGPGLTGEVQLDGQDGSYRLDIEQSLGEGARVSGSIQARASSPFWTELMLDGTVDLTCDDLARCQAALVLRDERDMFETLTDLGGRLEAGFRVGGLLESPEITGRVMSQLTGVAGLDLIDVSFDLTADTTQLGIDPFELQVGDNSVRGNVDLVLETGALDGRLAGTLRQLTAFSALMPATWTPSAGSVSVAVTLGGSVRSPLVDVPELLGSGIEFGPLDGVVDLQFSGRGSLEELTGNGTLTAVDLAWNDLKLGRATASIEFSDTQLEVESALPDYGAVASLSLRLDGDRPFEGTLRMSGTDLSPVGEAFRLPISGSTTLNATIAGSLATLVDTTVEVTLQQFAGRLGSVPISLQQPSVTLSYGPRGLILDETAFDIGESVVEFAGRLMPDGTGILTTHMRGGTDDLRAVFSAIADTQEWLTDVELAGMFTLDATASGRLDAPVVAGQLQLDDGRISIGDHAPLDQIDLRASYGDGLVALDRLSAMWQGASVRASGMAPLGLWSNRVQAAPSPEDPARLRVEVESLTPATLAGYLDDATVAQLDGLVNATVVLESDAPTLDAVRATLTLDEAAVTISGIPLRQRRPTQITVENGRLQVSAFDWGNDEDYLTLGGFVELGVASGEPVVDLTVTGSLDLQALGAFTPGTAAEGQANLIANIQGPRSSPDVTGTIELSNAGLRVADPRLVVSALNGALFLTQDTVTVHELQGQLNGGDLDITGSLRRVGLRPEGTLTISGRQVALSIPDGLRTEVDADIEVTLLDGETMLTGTATIQRGDYRESMSLTGGLLSAIDRRQDVQTVGLEQTTPIDAIRLDLRVVTAEDIVLDNNYLDAALAADIRLGGTFGASAVTGRVALLEGGRIRVGTRTYEVETGAIDFIDPTGIDPQVNIRAQTRASDYDITLSITGGQDTLTTTLQSDPPLPESDIVSLLLTGQTLSEASASPGTGARDQALGLISSEILGSAGRELGLDVRVGEEFDTGGQVRFDSSLIANDVDPTTRLTVGRRLNDQLMVIVSQNLRENDRFSVVSYLVRDGIEVRALFIDEVDRGYEVRHALEFGAPPTPERDITGPDRQRAVFTVAAIRFGGDTGYHVDRLAAETRLGPGDTFDFYRWQQDQDRLLRFYSDEGYREARITSRRTEGPGSDELTLDYTVTPGPLTRLVFEGDELPDAVRARLERAWELSVFDGFLMDEMRTIVDAELSTDGFLRARVETTVEASADGTTKVVTVSVTRGPRTERREITFTGNVALDEATLTALAMTVVEENGWRNTEPLERALSALYRRRGLLEALVTVNPLVFDGPVASLPVRVDEGRVFTLATIGFEGASIRPAGELRELLDLATGTPYLETEAQTAVTRVELDYRQRGFNAARVTARSTIDVDTGEVDLVVVVREGRQEVLAEVVVEGGTRTHPTLVSNALRLTQGEPVVLADWNLARKRLYDTGIFRTIDLRAETLDPDPLAERLAVSPIRARLVLEEWPAYSVRYGLRLDDLQVQEESKSTRDFGLGFAADASRRNLWGRGMTLGGSVRAAARGRVVRAYLRAPTFFGRSIRSSVFAQRGRDNMGEDESGFVEDLTSVTFEQRIQLPLDARTAYSASFDRVHTFEKEPALPDFPFDISLNIVRFAGNTVLDRRDSLFDATRGWFHSSNVEYGFEPGVGEINFAKYLAHQYHHWSVGPVVLATAGRLGLATGLGGDSLIPSERFFAGGANTVRGYAQDSLGPRSPIFDEAEGGNSLLIFNQEVRLPLFWRLGAAGFIDAGSVFETARDISVGDLAVGAGLGLRLLTPVGTLRLDYGFALTREEGDRLGSLHFALGQAF